MLLDPETALAGVTISLETQQELGESDVVSVVWVGGDVFDAVLDDLPAPIWDRNAFGNG
jgi:hypothetical protein